MPFVIATCDSTGAMLLRRRGRRHGYPDRVTEAPQPTPPDGPLPPRDVPRHRDAPWPVAVVAQKIKGYIDRLGTVWVEGEIAQWNGAPARRLRQAQRPRAPTHDLVPGLVVDARQAHRGVQAGRPRDRARSSRTTGSRAAPLSMQVSSMRHVGLGDLLERLERLRRQLAAEGLFDADRKKPLPFLPRCIGLITGKDSRRREGRAAQRPAALAVGALPGAARRRAGRPGGPRCPAAIRELDADPEVDVIIVARGGGDFQNLLGFSDETPAARRGRLRRPRSSARSGTRTTVPCSTTSPTCARRRRRMPPSASCRTSPRSCARVQQARARIGDAGRPRW